VQELCGLSDLGKVMRNKRYKWASSVYGQHLSELREVAEKILREIGDEDTEWRWIGEYREEKGAVEIRELEQAAVEEWSDGSCMHDRAAGAARTKYMYLGSLSTVADAEEDGMGRV